MDEIREITNEALRSIYSVRIYSDRLKTLSRECPDHPEVIHATGEMYRRKNSDRWSVEYYCPAGRDLIRSWQPDVEALTKQIAAEVLSKAGIDPSTKG